VYKDESLRFCLDDGAALVSEASGVQPTIRITPQRTRSAKPTEVLPGSRLTPQTHSQSLVPWLVAGAALLLVAVMGMGITILIFANHQSNTSSPNLNGSNVTKNVNLSRTPANVVDLAGTRWTQTSTISQMKELNFLANGTINGDAGDTWKQDGDHLTMSITNGYAIYEGTISGDRIDYKAHNKVNLDWTGTLYRARSAPSP
jgi:hypothetical protein